MPSSMVDDFRKRQLFLNYWNCAKDGQQKAFLTKETIATKGLTDAQGLDHILWPCWCSRYLLLPGAKRDEKQSGAPFTTGPAPGWTLQQENRPLPWERRPPPTTLRRDGSVHHHRLG